MDIFLCKHGRSYVSPCIDISLSDMVLGDNLCFSFEIRVFFSCMIFIVDARRPFELILTLLKPAKRDSNVRFLDFSRMILQCSLMIKLGHCP